MGIVYSTEHGRMCPECSQPIQDCICKKATQPKGDGVVRVRRESKGRGGKLVTVIIGVPLAGEELKTLASSLKRKCGSGGTIKDGTIEIQGDYRDLVISELKKAGFVVKSAGG